MLLKPGEQNTQASKEARPKDVRPKDVRPKDVRPKDARQILNDIGM